MNDNLPLGSGGLDDMKDLQKKATKPVSQEYFLLGKKLDTKKINGSFDGSI